MTPTYVILKRAEIISGLEETEILDMTLID